MAYLVWELDRAVGNRYHNCMKVTGFLSAWKLRLPLLYLVLLAAVYALSLLPSFNKCGGGFFCFPLSALLLIAVGTPGYYLNNVVLSLLPSGAASWFSRSENLGKAILLNYISTLALLVLFGYLIDKYRSRKNNSN